MNQEVPIQIKYCLTVEETAKYFGIGEKKLRQIAADNPQAPFLLMNGTKILFKRELFEKFLDEISAI